MSISTTNKELVRAKSRKKAKLSNRPQALGPTRSWFSPLAYSHHCSCSMGFSPRFHLDQRYPLGPSQTLSRLQQWQNRQSSSSSWSLLSNDIWWRGWSYYERQDISKQVHNQIEINTMKTTKQSNIFGRDNGWETTLDQVGMEDIWKCNTLVESRRMRVSP